MKRLNAVPGSIGSPKRACALSNLQPRTRRGPYSAAYGNIPTLCKGFAPRAPALLTRVKP